MTPQCEVLNQAAMFLVGVARTCILVAKGSQLRCREWAVAPATARRISTRPMGPGEHALCCGGQGGETTVRSGGTNYIDGGVASGG
eukprot:CAMPEP_0182524178 /NCGR_PEP_ID=MMETSP1323-20130603/1605_1 /TAXON_ID=236787 /ORGANISM="Florenciella parvula, Strain RCC1693" /LENGTH=85 /DNA_ID=CAMNT_0024732695 /DNA_START=287 /DNA_END=541 /DNA_ORIENTATION=-